MLLLTLSVIGCSRSFWRLHADREVYGLLPEKMRDPRWALPRIDITPAAESRFFDPYPPDAGPLPPDDPAANVYMRRVDGIRQSDSWHEFGRALSIENPQWLEPFGLTPDQTRPYGEPPTEGLVPPPPPANGQPESGGGLEDAGVDDSGTEEVGFDNAGRTDGEIVQASHQTEDGPHQPLSAGGPGGSSPYAPQCENKPFVNTGQYGIENLTLTQALELSYIHSREYQTQIEELYLAALALTFDRFQFNVRYLGLGGREPSSDLTFESIPREQNSLTMNNRVGISQLLPAGGQWLVEFANNTVWLFAGPNQTNTASVLSYSLVQPLLFGAGRAVVLEGLTQRERDTLYAARDLARFRKLLFADVVSGGPSAFLGILQQMQVVANRRNNIRQLEIQVDLLRTLASQRPQEIPARLPALPPGLQIPPELAGQLRYDAEQQMLYWRGDMTAEQERILSGLSDDPAFQAAANELIGRLRTETVTLDVAQLETQLANARNQLLEAERSLQDSLDQFKILLGLPPDFFLTIDDSLLDQFTLIDVRLFALEQRIDDFINVWARLDEDNPDLQQLRTVAAGLRELEGAVQRQGLQLIEEDIRRVDENMPQRLSRLSTQVEREAVRENVDRDRRLFADQREAYTRVEQELSELMEKLQDENLNLQARQEARSTLGVLREQLLKVAQSLQVIQAGLRVELISLQAFSMELAEATRTGLENRLDLMNAKAQVMDARRRQEVAANQLEAVLDIVAEGDVRTPVGENPFDFRGRQSSFRVGARFTAPLDQIAERNDYRLALIDYQRARRDYMALEDQVKFSIRQSWRQLRVLEQNFEITRQALRLAAMQLDQAVEDATAPVRPGQQRGAGSQGINLLNALDSVLGAQNDLIGIWVNYERSRINIYRDMGMMDIDPRGVWNDPFYQQNLPSSSRMNDDPQHQLGQPTALGRGNGAGPVFVRRGIEGDASLRNGRASLAAGRKGERPFGRGETVRRTDRAFLLPRKIEIEAGSAGGRAASARRRRRDSDRSEDNVRRDGGVRQPGDRGSQAGPVFHHGDR